MSGDATSPSSCGADTMAKNIQPAGHPTKVIASRYKIGEIILVVTVGSSANLAKPTFFLGDNKNYSDPIICK
jgi:hypothetical protein